MKNRSVLFLLAVAVLGAVSLTVFYRGARLLSPVSAAPRKVIVIFKTIDYRSTPFWGNVRDGVTSAGEDLGITVSIRGPAQESDVQGQIDIVQQSISEKPDAIVLAAADYNLLCRPQRPSRAAGSRSCVSTRFSTRTTPTCGSARTATKGDRSARRHSCAPSTPGTWWRS